MHISDMYKLLRASAAKRKNFATAKKAYKQMKIIKIKVWDFKNGKKGKKVTKIKSLTVNISYRLFNSPS